METDQAMPANGDRCRRYDLTAALDPSSSNSEAAGHLDCRGYAYASLYSPYPLNPYNVFSGRLRIQRERVPGYLNLGADTCNLPLWGSKWLKVYNNAPFGGTQYLLQDTGLELHVLLHTLPLLVVPQRLSAVQHTRTFVVPPNAGAIVYNVAWGDRIYTLPGVDLQLNAWVPYRQLSLRWTSAAAPGTTSAVLYFGALAGSAGTVVAADTVVTLQCTEDNGHLVFTNMGVVPDSVDLQMIWSD